MKERRNYCIDHRNKVVWVRVPRVASSSIKAAWPEPLAPNRPYGQAKKVDDSYLTIMFVRDPLRRFISAWDFKGVRCHEFNRRITLDRAIKQLEKKDPFDVDRHFRPQWTFEEGLRIDFLGHHETIENDWLKVMDLTNVKPLPHVNASRGKRTQLTKEQQLRLIEYYKKDYARYYPHL
jgi:hypothetical protein